MDEIKKFLANNLICSGCGVKIQMVEPQKLGYAPQELIDQASTEKKIICKRCHRIKHYNDVQSVNISEHDYMSVIKGIRQDKQALVVLVLDLFDFEGSWPTNIIADLTAKEVVLVINKSDIFPQSVKQHKIIDWAKKTSKSRGLTSKGVFFVSALKAHGLIELASYLLESTKQKNIYFIGATSTGKSTLINRIMPLLYKKAGLDIEDDIPQITTSAHSGTTIGNIYLPLAKNRQVVDTPGIVMNKRLTDQVCAKCLKVVTPRNKLKPKVYQLNSGQTLFLGGLARIDFVKGERQSMVVYVSNALNIHRTKLEQADQIWGKHKNELLTPACNECQELLALEQVKKFLIQEQSDITIAGLGWIKVQAINTEIVVHTPITAEVSIRDSLF